MRAVICLTAWLLTNSLLAQPYVVPERLARLRAAGVDVSASPTLDVGVSGRIPVFTSPRNQQLLAVFSAGAPVFTLSPFDTYRVSLGGAYKAVVRGPWQVTGGVSGLFSRTSNVTGQFTHLGVEAVLLPGYQADRWYAVLWLGYQHHSRTHIRHSGYTMGHFDDRYPTGQTGITGPHNGWVAPGFATVRLGAGTGYSIKTVTLHLNGGLTRQPNSLLTGTFGDLAQLPFFARFAVTYHW